MGIFKRHDQGDQQTSAALSPEMGAPGAQPDQTARMVPPFVSAPRGASPGVVPPPAAPMYSMRVPDSVPRVEADDASLVAERVRMARDPQQAVQERLRVAVQRVRRRSAQQVAPAAPRAARLASRPSFDPVRCAQAGLLNLAWSWQEAGAPIRAIHAYVQVLSRYPDTPAAAAAVADLVELSDILTDEGQFHIALGIYDQLEQLL